MAFRLPSSEWIKELSDQLNASDSYARAAKDWEGDFLFVVEPDEGYVETAYLYLNLYHGKSPGAEQVASADAKQTAYVISGPYKIWRRIVEGKVDPIQALMTRQLKLVGDMMKVMRYPKAAREIVACCARVPTEFA
ncbi:MAG: SCP2 sterol-binding domain-containing protein [Chloroflexota bacterium]